MKFLFYYILILIDFYGLPFLIKDTSSAMFMMIGIMPLVCLLTSMMLGLNLGISYSYPFIVALLFIPSIFIYYNYTAWVYSISYGLLAFVGECVPTLLSKVFNHKNRRH